MHQQSTITHPVISPFVSTFPQLQLLILTMVRLFLSFIALILCSFSMNGIGAESTISLIEECPEQKPSHSVTCGVKLSCGYGTKTECCGKVFHATHCTCSKDGKMHCAMQKPSCPCVHKQMGNKQKPASTEPIDSCPKEYTEGRRGTCTDHLDCTYGAPTRCCNDDVYYPQKCSCFKGSPMSCHESYVPKTINQGRCKCEELVGADGEESG
mmetsp:Transcript_41874/g.58884  ORF Transcript_41874/g.58884 Transcript_41874/m.58884 type:complete len:211 (+) Transcript_41874:23-655(+)